MKARRATQRSAETRPVPVTEDLHEWVLSLPWVVERPRSLPMLGVRSFAIDCEPLERRRLWLITGLTSDSGRADIAVILPIAAAEVFEAAGRGRRISPMPRGHVLMTACCDRVDEPAAVELVVLTAYNHAMT
jgi:hypothetical protein